jgi:hypothetical protein
MSANSLDYLDVLKSLTLNWDGAEYKLTALQITAAMGEPPVAECSLASGNDLAGKAGDETFVQGDPAKEAVIKLTTEYDAGRTLMTGFVTGVANRMDVKTTSASRAVALTIAHESVMLTTLNAASYRYYNNVDSSRLSPFSHRMPLLASTSLNIANDILRRPDGTNDDDAGTGKNFPYTVRRLFASMQKLSAKDGQDLIDKYLVEPDPSFKFFTNVPSNAVYGYMVSLVQSGYGQGDMLTAIKAAVNAFYCDLRPIQGGMEIIPAFGWLKKEDFELQLNEILSMYETGSLAHLLRPVSGIMLAVAPVPNTDNPPEYIYWPKDLSTTAGPGKLAVVPLPQWANELPRAWGSTSRCASEADGAKVKEARTPEALVEDNKKRAEAIAQAHWGTQQTAQTSLVVRVLWNRHDYREALGKVFKIPRARPGETSEGGVEYLFGSLQRSVLYMTLAAETAQCFLELSFAHVRTETMNEEFGFDKHPLFEYE